MEILEEKKIVITGGTGFIGSHIAERLCKNNSVIIVDSLESSSTDNLAEFKENVEFIQCDINDTDKLRTIFKGVDFIFHCAALGSVPRSVKDPLTSNHANIDGTLSVLVAAKEANVRRVIYSASSSAYGDTPTLPKTEDMQPKPISPYGITKYVGELYCNVFYNLYGLETISLRYMNVFGSRQNVKSHYAAVIPKFIKALLENEQPIIFGDGETTRDFTFVDNVVDANIAAALAPKSACAEVYNIACGQQTSLNQLLAMIQKALGTAIKTTYKEERPGDIKYSLADISKAKKVLGYAPDPNLTKQIALTVEYYKEHQELL